MNPWDRYAQQPQGAPPALSRAPWERYARQAATPAPAAAPAPSGPDYLRDLQVGTQGVGRGLANVLGAPVDLGTLALNGVSAGGESLVNLFLEDEDEISLPRITEPVGGGDWIADVFGSGVEAAGGKLVDPAELDGLGRLAYNVSDLGTQAAVGGAGLARAGTSRAATLAQGQRTPQPFDALVAPYTGPNVAKTFTGDVAAGAGAGAGQTAAQEYFPDSGLAEIIGLLGGGVVGGSLGTMASAPADVVSAISGFGPDVSIPYSRDGGMAQTSKRVADSAGRVMQGAAASSQAAAGRIAERAAAAQAAGAPAPTAGIASDDTGLIGLERGLRQAGDSLDYRNQFVANDQSIKQHAADSVEGLLDPGADQAAGLEFAKARPKQIAAEREAAALPLLEEATKSGAAIDAAPVAAKIDEVLAKAKRPAVRQALEQARKMLDAPGSDDLDTSVPGLYETRKAINDLIEGRTDNPTGQYAKKELIEVRAALDAQINAGAPEFGRYLDTYREGSRPLDVFEDSKAVARMVGEERDLRNVASRLLTGNEYGRGKVVQEVQEVVGADPGAQRAWRAAVADVLHDRVTNMAKEGEVSPAQVKRVWTQHQDTLRRVFSEEDMKTLGAAHEILEPLKNLSQQVVPGSATVDNTRLNNLVEGAVLAATGNAITTGMIMKRVKMAANMIPGLREKTLPYQTARVVERAMFDPDLAQLLLTRPMAEGTGDAWSAHMQRIIAGAEWSRSQSDTDDDSVEGVLDVGR